MRTTWPDEYTCELCGDDQGAEWLNWDVWHEYERRLCYDCASEVCPICMKDSDGLCAVCENGLF